MQCYLRRRSSKQQKECLLRQIANIAVPFGIMGPERRREVIDLADAYPGADTARRWLDQVMMEV